MRSWCVLLGLLIMTILRVSSGDCSNGFAGVQASDICCEPHCEICGGDGCSQQAGGADACCTSNIRDNGELCSTTLEAPCIIDYTSENLCSNGIVGLQVSDVCCVAQCGTCGGSGCSQLPGGMDACCTNTIRDNGLTCSRTLAAPCIVDDMPEAMCDNGIPGVQAGGVCCEAQCEICGGSGCSQRPGGIDACCTNAINANDEMCSVTMEAPCVIEY